MKLRTKFALFHFAVIFLPILLVAFITYSVAVNRVKQNAIRELRELALSASGEMESALEAVRKDFKQFTERLRGSDGKKLIIQLKGYASTLGESFAYILAYDREKELFAIGRRFGPERPSLFVSKEKIGFPHENKIRANIGGYTISFRGENPKDGIELYLEVKIPALAERVLGRYYQRERRFVYLVDGENTIIYHPVYGMIGQRDIPKEKTYLSEKKKVGNFDIYLIAQEDLAPYLIPFKSAGRIVLGFVFVFVLISVAISFNIFGDITKTVVQLAFEMRKLVKGEKIELLSLKRDDELGEIARHLNKIACDLYDSAQLRAFNKLSAFVVHDLKNLITEVSLLLRNLEVHYENPKFKQDALFTLRNTLEHMNRLILTLRRKERRMDLLNLKELIEEVVKTLEIEKMERITLLMDLLEDVYIKGDKEEVGSVFTNILRNSIEAIKERGEIRIRATLRGETVLVEIEDTGSGIEKDFLEKKLFRPFMTTKKKGLGLGLFHAKEVMNSIGGKIEIESTEGKGTKVLLYFRREG